MPVAAAVVVAAAGAVVVPAPVEEVVDSRRRLRARPQRLGQVPPRLGQRRPLVLHRLLVQRRVLDPLGARLVLGPRRVMSRGLVPPQVS